MSLLSCGAGGDPVRGAAVAGGGGGAAERGGHGRGRQARLRRVRQDDELGPGQVDRPAPANTAFTLRSYLTSCHVCNVMYVIMIFINLYLKHN